jgi:hypothetical protein
MAAWTGAGPETTVGVLAEIGAADVVGTAAIAEVWIRGAAWFPAGGVEAGTTVVEDPGGRIMPPSGQGIITWPFIEHDPFMMHGPEQGQHLQPREQRRENKRLSTPGLSSTASW